MEREREREVLHRFKYFKKTIINIDTFQTPFDYDFSLESIFIKTPCIGLDLTGA